MNPAVLKNRPSGLRVLLFIFLLSGEFLPSKSVGEEWDKRSKKDIDSIWAQINARRQDFKSDVGNQSCYETRQVTMYKVVPVANTNYALANHSTPPTTKNGLVVSLTPDGDLVFIDKNYDLVKKIKPTIDEPTPKVGFSFADLIKKNEPTADTKPYFKFSIAPEIMKDGTIVTGAHGSSGSIRFIRPDGTQTKFPTNSRVTSVPTVMEDGTAVVCNHGGMVFFFNPDGTKKGSFDMKSEGNYSQPLALKGGTVVIGGGDSGYVHFLKSDGSKKASFKTGGNVKSSPSVMQDGTIVVGSGDGKIYFLNPDGTKKSSFQTGGAVGGKPLVAKDGTVVVGSSDGNVYLFTPEGKLKATYDTGSRVGGNLDEMKDGTIVFYSMASPQDVVHFIDSNGVQKARPIRGGNPTLLFDDAVWIGGDGVGQVFKIFPGDMSTRTKVQVEVPCSQKADKNDEQQTPYQQDGGSGRQ